jgi:hypothetical protein
MIELTKEQDSAARHHVVALRSARRFWALSLSLSKNRLNDPAQLIAALDAFASSFAQARATYEELLLKFPNAVTLLLAYAEFLEVVANDAGRAADLRSYFSLPSFYILVLLIGGGGALMTQARGCASRRKR